MNVFGFAGWSDSGKTTLIERVVPSLVGRGLRVSVVKHAHERFDIDRPGKDSYRFRDAGSHEVLISSPARWALMHEHRGGEEPGLFALLALLSDCDLALVEGFKRDAIPKLEVHRPVVGKPMLWPDDPRIVAIASDVPIQADLRPGMQRFALDDVDAIATFVMATSGPFVDGASIVEPVRVVP